ncbi:MAG TPA: serine/threonine-protein kinase [Steroidobacteraceae bacterium]|nr:serine/threonine-protein kinase [Steroidobacteraceae bacterium]
MNSPPPDPPTWQRISDALDKGLDLSAAERQAWLTVLERTEPVLAHRLRELFAQHERLEHSGFLDSSPSESPGFSSLFSTSLAGKQAGAYVIERLLGRGGMGEVWLASRSDGRFEGRCALKFLERSIAQPHLAERFRHEGRLLARLIHPNIARLLDAGTLEDRQYLALEYVDGEPIDRYCESHSLDVQARVRLVLDVIGAVVHAHTNLVIHRDIKPSNVLVTHEGSVKLLDFGIAKLLRAGSDDDDPALTRFEEVALTPEYAAPEQLLGEASSTATDVYQIGMLLYVLLTARHPFAGSGTRSDRVRAAVEGRVPPASEFCPGSLRKQLRGDIDAILATALHKNPGERYTTAAALRDDLVRYLNREPVNARRGAALYNSIRFVQRHRLAVFATALVAIGLFAALAIVNSERKRAFALATQTAAVTGFLDTLITEAAASDGPVTVSDMVTRGEQLILADKSGDRESQAAVLLLLGSYRDNVGDHDGSIQMLDRGLALLRDSGDDELRARLVCGRAVAIAQAQSPEAALPAITRELGNSAVRSSGRADCLRDRSIIALHLDDREGGLRYAAEALSVLRSTPLASKTEIANYVALLAQGYYGVGRNREAFSTFAEALQMYAELGLERGENAMTARNNLAVAYQTAGMPLRALPIFEQNLRITSERGNAAPHPVLLINRAQALEFIGRYADARAVYQTGLDTEAGRDHTSKVTFLIGLANTSRRLGDLTAAGKYLDTAAEVLGPAEPADSFISTKLALARGMLALATGRLDDGQAQFARASISPHGMTTPLDIDLGKAEANLLGGDAAAAAQNAKAALSKATTLQGDLPWSFRTGLASLMLGRALQKLGDHAKAHDAFDTAVKHLSNTVAADHPELVRARELLLK